MVTRLPDHADALNVFLVDAEVGAPDGDGDPSPHGAKTRDDLDGETQRWGTGFFEKKGFEMDLKRLVVQ